MLFYNKSTEIQRVFGIKCSNLTTTVFRQPKGDHYSIEETGTTNLAQPNQAAVDYPYHSANRQS
jgi:hypothetical protein